MMTGIFTTHYWASLLWISETGSNLNVGTIYSGNGDPWDGTLYSGFNTYRVI